MTTHVEEVDPIAADLTLSPSDAMPEALRKILLRHFQDFLEHEPMARLGTDPEGVHKMRVAARRMRSIYHVFGDYLPKSYRKHPNKTLKFTGRILGAVRDLDVLMIRTQEYLQADADRLQALLNFNQTEYNAAQTQLIHWLDSSEYQRFAKRFSEVLMRPLSADRLHRKTGTAFPFQVNHLLPALLYQQYGNLRRYETLLSDFTALHPLRIDAKRMRYTLDSFAELLGEDVIHLIEKLKILQDYLGEVHDAQVAIAHLSLAYDCVPIPSRPAIADFQNYVKVTHHDLIVHAPEIWERFENSETRHLLATIVERL